MNPNRTERRKDETRGRIVTAALALFRAHGIDQTTMEQIAGAADVARGTLYNHFPVKEAILDEYVRQSFASQAQERIARFRTLPDTRARMSAMLLELVEGIRRWPELFERYFTYRIQQMLALKRGETQYSGFAALEEEIVRLGQDSGELRGDLPENLLLALFEFAFVEVAQAYFADPRAFDPNAVVAQCVELYMNGAGKQA